MWNERDKKLFADCIKDIIDDPRVQSMENIPQHAHNVSCLDHCVFVAYISFIICRRYGLNYCAAARAGLLHDMYLCNWKETDIGLFKRLLIHPQMALENAASFGLSTLERDIIAKHMWPVTFRKIPRHKESAVVNIADKFCTIVELLHIYEISKAGDALLAFNHRRRKLAAVNH